MKPEIVNGVKTIGPWGWCEDFCDWCLFGEIVGSQLCWHASCLSLTGHAEPGEPVRVRVPIPAKYDARKYMHGGVDYITVSAWPITSHGLSYYVWADSRRVLRYIERLGGRYEFYR